MARIISDILSGPLGLIDRKLGQTVSGIGLTVAGIVTGNAFLVSLGSFQLSQASAPRPIKPEQTSSAIKAERPPRISAYGRLRLYGAYILYTTNGDGVAVDVYAFHDGQIDGIEGWYLGDKKVTRLANGFVSKAEDKSYGDNKIAIGANLGLPTETAHPSVAAALPAIWTEQHRGDGVVTGYMISQPVKAKDFQTVYRAGGPNNTPLSIVVRAQKVFDWRDPAQSLSDPSSWKWSENVILQIAHYQLVRNGKTWARHFAPTLAYWTAAADDCDRVTPHGGGRTNTTTARLAGDGFVDVKDATGITAGTSITLGALGPFPETHEVVSVAPHDGFFTLDLDGALSRDWPAETPVTFSGTDGGTEPRYRSCFSHRHAGQGSEHKAVIVGLLACCDGYMSVRPDGALVVYSGHYYEPTVTVGPGIVTSYTVEDGVEDENAVNEVGVTYISAAHDYNQIDTNPVTAERDILLRGAVRPTDLNNQVPSPYQARRLAARQQRRSMAKKRGTFTTLASGTAILSERYVNLDLSERMGDDGEFIAYRGPAEITALTRNLQTGAISASWIAADRNIDQDDPTQASVVPPSDIGEREPLEAPMIISATPVFSAVGQNPETEDPAGEPIDGTVSTGARVLIASTGPDRADLTWYGRWRVGASGSWNEREYADADPGPGVSFLTEFVPLVANLNVETAYQTGDGRYSPWSDSVVVDTRQT